MKQTKKIYLMFPETIGKIEPELYGHFSEQIGGVFYDGLWVGEDSAIPNIKGFRRELVEKLKAISPPVLRWPGGCFAETYNWRDGIGANRPTRPSWWTRSDGRYESNSVGTHEFLTLCELIGAKPYLAANLTSTTPQDIRDWMDYCLSPRGTTALALEREKNGRAEPFSVPYWGVGNENWGGGGRMTPEHYTDEFRRYATLMHNIPGDFELFACGANSFDYGWTQRLTAALSDAKQLMNGCSLHYYCGNAGDPLHFSQEEWYQLLRQANRMEELIARHWHIIAGADMAAEGRLVIDEWGCWHPGGSGPSHGYNLFEQQSTMRDAMVSALTLNIFNNNCEKLRMANVAQLVNNLHALFLASGENCICTPTYHVFDLYKGHQGGTAIRTAIPELETADGLPLLSVSASVQGDTVTVTVANLSAEKDVELSLCSIGQALQNDAQLRMLSGELHACNTFEEPDAVCPQTGSVNPNSTFCVPKGGIAALTAKLA